MASTSVRKQQVTATTATKDTEPSGKGKKGQLRGKGKQAAKRGRPGKFAADDCEAEDLSTKREDVGEDSSAAGSSSTVHESPASAAAAMEEHGAMMGKKAMGPPGGMPPGMPGMEDMMKMMANMPDDLKKVMGSMDMKNFSFTGFVESVCMAAWHSKDDGSGSPQQHIPEGSDSRRLLMALARGDSEGEAAAESLTLMEEAAFKKPFELATRVLRGKKLIEQEQPAVEPVRTTRSQRSAPEVGKPKAEEEPGSPTIQGRRRSRGSKRPSEEEEEGAAAPAAVESPEENVALSKKRRILVSLIKGEAKSGGGQESSDQGEAGPKGATGSKGKEAEEPSPPSEPSSRLKKNAKNLVGKEIDSGSSPAEGTERGAGDGEADSPASSCSASEPLASSGDKNECAVCGDQFDTKYYVKNHMRIHTGERPFACEECGKTFTHKASLKAHMDTHGREVQNFYCKLCDRKFEYAYLLERHNKSHERHQCQTCGKSMCNAQALASHVRSEHSAKFSYECDVCRKSYARFSAFVAHQQTHADNPAAKENVEFEDGLGGEDEDMPVSQGLESGAGASMADKEMEEEEEAGKEEDSADAPRAIAVSTA